MFGKLLANEGFNKFAGIAKSFMGWGRLQATGGRLKRAAGAAREVGRSGGKSSYFKGQMRSEMAGAGRNMSAWANAGGDIGKRAARIGGAAAGGIAGIGAVSAGADFLNPWGLGWGD